MDPDHWRRLKDIFSEALERKPEERRSYLDKACSGNTTLRAEVEALLSSHAETGGFMEPPGDTGLGEPKDRAKALGKGTSPPESSY